MNIYIYKYVHIVGADIIIPFEKRDFSEGQPLIFHFKTFMLFCMF